MSKETESKELVVMEDFAIVKQGVDIAKALNENLGGERISFRDLDTAKLPSGRGTKFIVPDKDGNESEADEIRGVIIHVEKQRVYYEKTFDETGGGVPPDCMSYDMIRGIGTPGGECETCAMNQFDQEKQSKPCKEKRLFFVLRESDFMPLFLPISVGSIGKAQDYLTKLALRNTLKHTVETVFKLTTATNKRNIKYPQLVVERGRKLNPREIEIVEAYREGILPFISQNARVINEQPVPDSEPVQAEEEQFVEEEIQAA